ncbi:BTB/POZ domain-containing protein KCTD4-like isoform X2 [Physella acuta]|uniref:BTB/POZ domain-containing protein KCTD4-like isoform X2 n=1 Tax=Physella acuta TaxID=109671 RepID=UPI0027DD3BA4|nr:BTB/POZ domain-containing protein KCTD4-like isoform X2 [Physella acuta]
MSPTIHHFYSSTDVMSRGGGGGGGSDKVMRLNVGGTFYTTTKPTLQAVPGTFLHQISTGAQYCPRDDRGYYVIDRDGHAFRYVLNFLRTSKLIVPMGYRELDILREEGEFYGLEKLVAAIDSIIDLKKRKARARRWNGAAKRLSASVGENLNNLPEDDGDDLDFFEDSWIGGTASCLPH